MPPQIDKKADIRLSTRRYVHEGAQRSQPT